MRELRELRRGIPSNNGWLAMPRVYGRARRVWRWWVGVRPRNR